MLIVLIPLHSLIIDKVKSALIGGGGGVRQARRYDYMYNLLSYATSQSAHLV